MTTSAPHLREDLLTPRFYTTDIKLAAQTDFAEAERVAFEAMFQEMESTTTAITSMVRPHSSVCAARLGGEGGLIENYLVHSCVSESPASCCSAVPPPTGSPELSRLFALMDRDEVRHAGYLNRALAAEGIEIDLTTLSVRRPIT